MNKFAMTYIIGGRVVPNKKISANKKFLNFVSQIIYKLYTLFRLGFVNEI